jgi:nucleotide-binding universal stress UspA family protein
MKKSRSPFLIHRILVALDASPHSLAALDAAVDLAARLDAELEGLFVEDVALLRVTELPCAREVLYFSAAEAPLTREGMESELKSQSERARQALQAAAQRAQVEWTFRTARGEVTTEVKAAAAGVDLLAIGKGGWSLGRRLRAGSTALELAASALSVLLLPERGIPEDAHLVVYFDGSPAAHHGLQAAARLARAGLDGITLLVAMDGEAEPSELESQAMAVLNEEDLDIHSLPFHEAGQGNLLEVLKTQKSGVLVIGGRELLGKLPPLDIFLRETEMPILLLGDESNPEGT